MGSTADLINRHLNHLEDGAIFTTRDLLAYGPRHCIDNNTSRLVKKGKIDRLTYGVFRKASCSKELPDKLTILQAKMRAWGKVFWVDKAAQPRPDPKTGITPKRLVAFVAGSTSAFRTTTDWQVILRHMGPRKMKLSSSPAGQAARKVWNAGKEQLQHWFIDYEYRHIGREGLEEFFKFFRLLPAWLNDWIDDRRRRYYGPRTGDLGIDPADLARRRPHRPPFWNMRVAAFM